MPEPVNFKQGQRLGAQSLNAAINSRISDIRVGPGLLLQRIGSIATIALKGRPTAAGTGESPTLGTLFGVVLVQSGGSNGTATSAPTYTYIINDITDDFELNGTPQEPRLARPNGAVTAATLGMAYYGPNGDVILFYAHEVPTTDTCA